MSVIADVVLDETSYLILEMNMRMSALAVRVLDIVVHQDECDNQLDLDIS